MKTVQKYVERFFDRTNPIAYLFLIALLMIIIGSIFYALQVLAAIGILIVVIYILYLLLWLKENFR